VNIVNGRHILRKYIIDTTSLQLLFADS